MRTTSMDGSEKHSAEGWRSGTNKKGNANWRKDMASAVWENGRDPKVDGGWTIDGPWPTMVGTLTFWKAYFEWASSAFGFDRSSENQNKQWFRVGEKGVVWMELFVRRARRSYRRLTFFSGGGFFLRWLRHAWPIKQQAQLASKSIKVLYFSVLLLFWLPNTLQMWSTTSLLFFSFLFFRLCASKICVHDVNVSVRPQSMFLAFWFVNIALLNSLEVASTLLIFSFLCAQKPRMLLPCLWAVLYILITRPPSRSRIRLTYLWLLLRPLRVSGCVFLVYGSAFRST